MQSKTVAAHVGNAQEGQHLRTQSNQPRLSVRCIKLVPHMPHQATKQTRQSSGLPPEPSLPLESEQEPVANGGGLSAAEVQQGLVKSTRPGSEGPFWFLISLSMPQHRGR